MDAKNCYCSKYVLTAKEQEDLPQHAGQTFCFAVCIALYVERSKHDEHFSEVA